VGTNDGRLLLEKHRLTDLPAFLVSGAVGEAYRIAQGQSRGLRMPKPPELNYHEGWETEYDYQAEKWGRAILWAAGKEPPAHLELSVAQPEFQYSEPKKLTVQLSGPTVGRKCRLQLTVRRPADKPFVFPEEKVESGTSVDFTLPEVLSAGEYHADARIISEAGVETWATVPFRVTAGRTVAEVALLQDWGETGDNIKGSVVLNGRPLPGESVRVRLLDRRRRELARKDFSAPGDTTSFQFAVAAWMPGLVTVEAQVRQNGAEVSRAYQYFTVTCRNRGQFNFMMWSHPTGTLAPYAQAVLAQTGVTVCLAGRYPYPVPETALEVPRFLSAYDTAMVPYTFHINREYSPEGIKLPYCWNDAEAVQDHAEKMARYNMNLRQVGVFAYSLGDEILTHGSCLSPHCARAYRDYLQEIYGNLAALNASWDTTFTDWSEVGLSNPSDNDESTAFNAGNYPRWFDRQAFKAYNFVRYCQNLSQGFQAIDPQAKVGFEGSGTFGMGDDIDLIVRRLGFWLPYPGTQDEVIRSLPSRSGVVGFGNWMGYQKDADSLLRYYWRMMTRGADTVGWWTWSIIGDYHGWLAPDFRPFPAVKDILEDTRFIREGVGDILVRSPMQDDGITLLYSFPSVFAHKLNGGDGYSGYETCHLKAQKLIRDMGLQYRYVTDRMLQLGEFDPSLYRILLLLRADALGTREADMIRRFAESGGTVIADVRTGLFDDHCKPRPQGILDDFLGLRREGENRPKQVELTLTGKDGNPISFGPVLADPSVKVDTATAVVLAADEIPLLLKKRVGKGTAILLNFSSFSLPDLGREGVPAGTGEFFETLFAEAGVKPALEVTTGKAGRARDMEVTRWKNGDLEIISLYQPYGEKRTVTVSLKTRRAVYDLRARKFLGTVGRFKAVVVPARASFFALFPAPAARPRLMMGKKAIERGNMARCTVSSPDASGLHAFLISVSTGGKELAWFQKKIVAGGTGTTVDLPVAFNDPAGRWEIRAIDVLTGQSAAMSLAVR
jgi:hypothetical protein